MNLLFLADVTIERVIGGAERVLRHQAVGLARQGHRVRVIARSPADAAPAEVSIDGVMERRYPVTRTGEAAFIRSTVVNTLREFDRALETGPIDAVILHQSLCGLGPILLRRRRVATWITVCHSLAHEEYDTRAPRAGSVAGWVRRRLNIRARRWIERRVLRRCDRVVVLSAFMKQRVQAAHGLADGRIVVNPGAADITVFHPPTDRDDVRRGIDLPTDRTILFTVRNLVPRMGLENLLHGIALLKEDRGSLLVLIGGDGPLRPELQSLIRSLGLERQVTLLGFIPEERLPRYYQAADLVLMPTLTLEGFGLVTVEAMACGTPVLGTPVGALPEVLSRVDPGLIAAGTDGGDLAAALGALLRRFREQPGERDRLAAKGLALIREDYNWDRHNRELARLLG